MGYVDDNLLSGEQITCRTRVHWIIYVSLRGLLTLFIAPLIQRRTTELAVTNRRVVVKTGFIGTGGTKESFNTIAQPLEFRKAVQEAIDQNAPQYARVDQLTDCGTLR